MASKRQEKLKSLLKVARANGGLKVLGGDPLTELVADTEKAWEVLESLGRYLHLPDDEDAENDLIITYESYFLDGNKSA